MTLASGGGESELPVCGSPAIFSVHLASSAVTPAGSVHISRGDNMYMGAVEEIMCVVYVSGYRGIVVMDVIWLQVCVCMI